MADCIGTGCKRKALQEEVDRLRARALELEAVHEDASGAVLEERERWAPAAAAAIDALEWHASKCCEDSMPQETVDALAMLRKALGPNA